MSDLNLLNSNSQKKINENNENIQSHLEELRNCLLFSLLIILICLILSFCFASKTIKLLQTLAPVGSSFFQLKPGELFFVHLKTSCYLAFSLAYPFLLNQIKIFIWPGLKQNEKKISLIILFGSPLLFILGILFGFFIALKPMLNFLFGFGLEAHLVEAHYSLENFISFVFSIIFMLSLSFQLPILILILALLNLINSVQLISCWKYVIFGSFVLAAIITPTPDPFNMILVGIALILLYVLSIILIKLFRK